MRTLQSFCLYQGFSIIVTYHLRVCLSQEQLIKVVVVVIVATVVIIIIRAVIIILGIILRVPHSSKHFKCINVLTTSPRRYHHCLCFTRNKQRHADIFSSYNKWIDEVGILTLNPEPHIIFVLPDILFCLIINLTGRYPSLWKSIIKFKVPS